jgi:hypothetical protein
MASEVFLSQSELSPKIQLSNIDFVKNKKIKRQIGQDDWLYLTINEKSLFFLSRSILFFLSRSIIFAVFSSKSF